jgi:preprotein translocase subunit SecF
MTILLSLVLMLLYIGIRFWSFGYAVGAIVALFHDALAILLFFLITDKEISINVIGAILAVLGYSVNDTIVIFSRIRDELKGKTTKKIDDVVNYCLNATLRRTILTSFATALVTVSLITLGGETLRDLSLALLIGIVFGTYSSIYIASPIMLLLRKVA